LRVVRVRHVATVKVIADVLRPQHRTLRLHRVRPRSFTAAETAAESGQICLDVPVTINRTKFALTWNLPGIVSASSTLTIRAAFTRH
jgi:hypothetical protein